VGFPAANAAEQRLPVSAVHRVCVRVGLAQRITVLGLPVVRKRRVRG
jgi:hypothetical protein